MKKVFNVVFNLVCSAMFITAGICFIIYSDSTIKFVVDTLGILLLINAIFKTLSLIVSVFHKNKITSSILEIILNLGVGLWFLLSPSLLLSVCTIIFGIYIFVQAIVNFINCLICKYDKLPGIIPTFISGTILLIFSLLFIFSPKENLPYFCIVVGIFFIVYGIIFLINLTSIKTYFPLPVLFTMFVPQALIRKIKKGYKTDFKDDSNIDVDLEVLIHLAPKGSAGMGHVEIGFEGKIYSYSCYNYVGRRLFGGIGDGILGIHDHDAYIKYCTFKRNRFIVSFGLKLTEKQKNILRNSINDFISKDTEIWYPEIALYDMGLLKKDDGKDFKEMSNELYMYADTKFIRFTKGKYKTFFVFRTNCVTGTDEILSKLDLKLFPLEGIISPGTYYKFMNDQYHTKNSPVISKILYTKEYINKNGYKYKMRKLKKP